MKTRNKALLLTMCAIALVVGSVMGTIAYLTDTKTVTNTFTLGNVYIELDEATLDKETGKATDADRTTEGNTDVKLIPGRTIDKDPTVTVKANSENAYVRMKVKVENFDALKAVFSNEKYYSNGVFLLQELCDWNSDSWEFVSANGNIYEFRYKEAVAKAATDTKLPALFNSITVPGDEVTNENIDELATVQIIVTAEAIQAESFADADAAWAAFG